MDIPTLAIRTGQTLQQHHLVLAVAESCTGGWVAQAVTSVAGSSDWFDRGFVTYSNVAKQELLGVGGDTLRHHGAVSEQTAREMVQGALARSHAHVALAITGIAGPGGGTPEKPVGTVWLAWFGKERSLRTAHHVFDGDREAIRRQAVIAALDGLIRFIEG